jgi:hypothetical protein
MYCSYGWYMLIGMWPKHDGWYMLMQVWTNYQLWPGSIERIIRTNPVRKLPCWQSSNGQDSDMLIWILPRLLKCRVSLRKEREHDVGEAILSCLEMSWDGGLTPWLTSGWKMRCVNEGTRSLPVACQIFHGIVCAMHFPSWKNMSKLLDLLGVVPLEVLADQSKWVISKSH